MSKGMVAERSVRLFVAGATGVVGSELIAQAMEMGVPATPHLRPKTAETHKLARHPDAAVFDLADHGRLREAMDAHTTVVQLIGTMRHRFAAGDTYESSDIGTTRQLVEAARGTHIRHIVLLGAVGTGTELGAYFKAKAEAERIVRDSSIAYTIFRPSSFIGGPHKPPPGVDPLLRLIGRAGFERAYDRFRPIKVEDLARAILVTARDGHPRNVVLEGRPLWDVVERVKR